MQRLFLVLIAIAAVAGSGVMHGMWTSRWHPSTDLEAAVAAVNKVPLTVGDWRGQTVAVPEEAFIQTGALGHWTRVYRDKDQAVTVILMCGKAGRMAVHTPDVCYSGVGYEMTGAPSKIPVGPDAEFWTAVFRKEHSAGATHLQISWAWKAQDAWLAPDQPRWTFRGARFLYKLYVVREARGNDASKVSEAFLETLVPD